MSVCGCVWLFIISQPGADATNGEIALNAIMEIDALVDALLGRSNAAAADQAPTASAAAADTISHETSASSSVPDIGSLAVTDARIPSARGAAVGGDDDDLPDWLLSAAQDLGTSVERPAPDGQKRRPRRIKKIDD